RGEPGRAAAVLDALPLFAARPAVPPPAAPVAAPSALVERLAEVDPDALSPREALDLVYALKGMV
ncbi:MAG: hypothetical protein ACFBWO_18290, partial [Paracoccaceae bacterium]